MKKRLLETLVVLCLIVGLLPSVVFAEDIGSQYTITDAEGLKSIVSQVNAGNNFEGKTIYIQSDIDLNPGYAFEFDEDSGLVAVKYENKIVFYIGTAYQQKVPTGLSSYAMAGNYYTYNGDSYISIDNSHVSKDSDTVTISVGESSYTLSLWKPMGTFSEQGNDAKAFAGILDGQGHTISGLFISDSSAQYQGLIGYSTGVVENITLSNSFIYCGQSSGSCVGYNSGTIKNCTNNGTITGFIGGAVHGGICGENYGTVTQCINNGLISTDYNGSGGNQAGGIVGVNYAIVSSSINYGAVWCGAAHVGGIVGYNCDEIKDCENYGVIGSSHNQVGGIAGNNNAWQDYVPQIKSCTNYGTVVITHTKAVANAGNNIGGIAGASTGKGVLIENCSNQGTVEGSSYVGGIVGKLDGSTVENCPNFGEVTGDQYIGGIIGSMFSTTVTNTVKECINKGQVQSSTSNDGIAIGGIVGEKRSNSPDINVLSDCYYLIETISYTKKNSYGVCLSVNDGTMTSDSIIQNTFPIFIKDGYKFDGWYDNDSFTGEVVTTPETDKTYYAKWTEKVDQSISYENTTVEKHINSGTFTNELTQTTVDGEITYISSNTDVATVNETTGEVTIVGTGTATITATVAETDIHKKAVAEYTLTVTDHSFTDYVFNNDATCTVDGTKTAKCDFCDVTDTVTDEGTKTEHDWTKTTYAWSGDGKSCTATHVCLNDNSHTETVQATITSEQTKDPNYTEMGETTYTATFDVDWASQQTKTVVDVPAIGTGNDNDKLSDLNKKTPQTSDTSNMWLWFALLAISVVGVGTTLVITKKRNYYTKHTK